MHLQTQMISLKYITQKTFPTYIQVGAIATIALSITFITFYKFSKKHKKSTFQRASKFRVKDVPKHIDTIVIGSGIGSMTCANLLARSGQKVVVLEQHPTTTGGCTHSFREENCEFDTGLHYVPKDMSDKTTRSGALMSFMSDGAQEWTAFSEDEPYDEIVFPHNAWTKKNCPNIDSYPFFSGEERVVEEMVKRIEPENEEMKRRVRLYLDICADINKGFTSLGLSRILPPSLQYLVKDDIERLMKYASMTVRNVQHAVLHLGRSGETLLKDGCPEAPHGPDTDLCIRRLKAVLTHPIGDYAVQPREASMAAHGVTMIHYMNGGAYTKGPTQNISLRLANAIRNAGGEVFIDAKVKEIIIENGRAVGVKLCNTSNDDDDEEEDHLVKYKEIRAKNIVCGTSVFNLYRKLLPHDLNQVKKFNDPMQRSIQQSNGHIFLFCKIQGSPDDIYLPNHNLWYFNGYDLDLAFDEYFHNPTNVRPPTVYIGFPCTKDVTWKTRFPGTSNCILISDGLYSWFEKWRNLPVHHRGKDYEHFKNQLTKHLLDILYEKVPQVKGKVLFHDLGTPLTEETFLSSYRGGSYGTKCNTTMFSPINRNWTTNPRTTIPGLFMAGSDAFLPSVTGSMYGGCLGACSVLGYFGKMRLTHYILHYLARQLQKEDPKLTYITAYKEAFRRMTK